MHPQVHASTARPIGFAEQAELVVGDVTDPQTWDDLLTGFAPDVVVHLAAETGTAQSLDEASRHARVNVVGTTEMLDALGRHSIVPSHTVLSSSRAVYGEGRWERDSGVFQPGQRSHAQFEAALWDFTGAHPIPSSQADTVPAPTSVYGATKLAQEHILGAWTNARGGALTVLRLQNVYGPGQSLINSYTGIVTLFSRLARENQVIPLYEDGLITRDFVYIDDVAAAFAAALTNTPASGFARYDIGSGEGTTILELANTIAAYHGSPAPETTGQYRDGDVRYAAVNIEATTAGLGWKPTWSLERGMAALQSWIETESATHA
jgi:dTDP-L-rhamnose 4-epimerase